MCSKRNHHYASGGLVVDSSQRARAVSTTVGPAELFVLGSGDPEKQALVYADITNPQSLNKYQYTFNNPLRYVDPDGQSPQDGLEARLRHDERRLAEGKISKEEFIARRKAEGVGALVGLSILAGLRAPAAILALARWAAANPDKANQLAQEAVQLSSGNPAPGLGGARLL
jgi:hypothetical protein